MHWGKQTLSTIEKISAAQVLPYKWLGTAQVLTHNWVGTQVLTPNWVGTAQVLTRNWLSGQQRETLTNIKQLLRSDDMQSSLETPIDLSANLAAHPNQESTDGISMTTGVPSTA